MKTKVPTNNSEVDALLKDLLGGVKEVLGGHFVGLYLYGSLATGGFAPSRSDIDFLVVTRDDLCPHLVADLEALHQRLWSSGLRWAAKLEGVYMPSRLLRRHNPSGPALPTVNERKFYLAPEGPDWVIQRYVLRENQAIVEGPSIRDRIDPVSPDDLRAAVRSLLDTWWASMLKDPSKLSTPGYTAYAVLSMCRALFLLERGDVVSKEQAAAWALRSVSPEWTALIAEARRWREGDPEGPPGAVLPFISYTIARSRLVFRDTRPV